RARGHGGGAMSWNDAVFLLPEIILSIGASLLLVLPVIGKRRGDQAAKWVMLALLGITAITILICSHAVENMSQTRGFAAMFALDSFSIFFKIGRASCRERVYILV